MSTRRDLQLQETHCRFYFAVTFVCPDGEKKDVLINVQQSPYDFQCSVLTLNVLNDHTFSKEANCIQIKEN